MRFLSPVLDPIYLRMISTPSVLFSLSTTSSIIYHKPGGLTNDRFYFISSSLANKMVTTMDVNDSWSESECNISAIRSSLCFRFISCPTCSGLCFQVALDKGQCCYPLAPPALHFRWMPLLSLMRYVSKEYAFVPIHV